MSDTQPAETQPADPVAEEPTPVVLPTTTLDDVMARLNKLEANVIAAVEALTSKPDDAGPQPASEEVANDAPVSAEPAPVEPTPAAEETAKKEPTESVDTPLPQPSSSGTATAPPKIGSTIVFTPSPAPNNAHLRNGAADFVGLIGQVWFDAAMNGYYANIYVMPPFADPYWIGTVRQRDEADESTFVNSWRLA